jgi:hypothetical protein
LARGRCGRLPSPLTWTPLARILSELHIDRAYLASDLVRDRGPDLAIYCKAWRVRNTGGRYPKTSFARARIRA